MLKINSVQALKASKISFYSLNILTFAFAMILTTIVASLPIDAVNGFDLGIGATVTSVIQGNIIESSHVKPVVIVLFVLMTISIVGSIISFALIKFKFVFDSSDYTKMSIAWIAVDILLLIVLSVIIFTQKIDTPINFGINNPNYISLGVMYKYNIVNNIFSCERSAVGITSIIFISIELFIMFVIWLYFSFKIIKHKYIK